MPQKKNDTHFLVTKDYLMYRDAAFHMPAEEIAAQLPIAPNVYGIILDLPLNPRTMITLSIYANGAVNLFSNSGYTYLGASKRYTDVLRQGQALVTYASRILSECTKTTQYDLPTGREHHIFLLTRKNGTYMKIVNPTELSSESTGIQSFCVLYQRLLETLNLAQRKDNARGAANKNQNQKG